jgi:hypothetical protein
MLLVGWLLALNPVLAQEPWGLPGSVQHSAWESVPLSDPASTESWVLGEAIDEPLELTAPSIDEQSQWLEAQGIDPTVTSDSLETTSLGGLSNAMGQADGIGSTGGSSGAGAGQGDLAAKLVDPTAAVTTLNFQDRFTSQFWGLKDSQNTFTFQPVIPFQAFGLNHILRTTTPWRVDGPQGQGLDPVSLFDLIVFPRPWGRFGIGPVMTFLPGNTGRDPFQIGPAVGAVTQKGKWTFGVFNQNLFSSDTEVSSVQPVLAYVINPKWSLALGDLQETYDWRQDRWVALPVGFQVARLMRVGKTTMRVGYAPQYNFIDDTGSPRWTHYFLTQLILR